MTRLSASASALGLLTLTSSLPMIALGMKGGELADRFEKRRILILTQFLLMLLAFALSALVWSGALRLGHLYAFALLSGVALAFDLPASQAFAPELVVPAQIPQAIGMMQAIFHGGRLVGPAIAGVLIQRFGEGSAFFANGVSFLAVIGSLLAIAPSGPAKKGRSRGGGLGEGLRYVGQDTITRSLLTLVVLCMALAFPFLVVLMAFYVRYVLRAGVSGMGTMMSASGLGAMAGAILLVFVGPSSWRIRLWLGVLGIAVAVASLAVTTRLAVAACLSLLLSFATSQLLGTTNQTIQIRVPPALRGRVMALYGIAFTSVMPLSGLLLSLLADATGLVRLMKICAVLFATFGTVLLVQLGREPLLRVESGTSPPARE
jgi:MFS family permease